MAKSSSTTAAPRRARFTVLERVLLTYEILTQYVRARRLLRSRPLPDVLLALRADLTGGRGRGVVDADPRRLAWVVVKVLRFIPADTRCLMRSLTLLALLTRRGTDAALMIGVVPSATFGAHAWLELDGQPLLAPGPDSGRLVEL